MQTSSVFKQKGKKNSIHSRSVQCKPVSPGLKKDASLPRFLKGTSVPVIQGKFEEDAQVRRKVLDPAEEEILEETDNPQVQRQSDEEVEEGVEVSPKLQVGSPDDTYEQEADQVAEQVMRMPDTNSKSFPAEKEDQENVPSIQAKSSVSTPLSGKAARAVQTPGAGSPLPVSVRSKVESALGKDFSHVLVHDDVKAADAARSINAKAFTHKNDIFLGKGQNPHDTSLMAHELTHVVQQKKGLESFVQCETLGALLTEQIQKVKQRRQEEISPVYWIFSDDRTHIFVSPKAGVSLTEVAVYLYGEGSNVEDFAAKNNLSGNEKNIVGLHLRLTGQKLSPVAYKQLQSAPKVPAEEDPALFIARKRKLDDEFDEDFNHIVSKLDETHYSSSDEGEVIRILRKWGKESFTTNPVLYPNGGEYLDKMFRKLTGKTKDVGIISYQITSYYSLIFNHFDRVAEVRAIRDAYSRNYKRDEGFQEMSFGSFFWDQVKEGVVRDQIIGYFQGLGDAAVGFVKGLYTLITDPMKVLEAIGKLPQTLAYLWEHRKELWNKFANASPQEQGRIIGRLFGEIEIMIATMGAGSGAQGGTAAPRLAMATAVVPGRGGVAALSLSSGGTIVVDLARLGEGARMVSMTSQLSSVAESSRQQADEIGSSKSFKKTDSSKKSPSKVKEKSPEADRFKIENLDDIDRMRRKPPQKPKDMDSVHEQFWNDYQAYYDKRLADLEGQLKKGNMRSDPPRTWESYRTIRESRTGQTLRGRAHQDRVTRSMDSARTEFLTESDVGVSKIKNPGRTDVKYPDQLILDKKTGDVTTVSNKSRDFKSRVSDYTTAELNKVRDQVRADVKELFEKYGGDLYIRRKSHPLFDKKVSIRELILIYENKSGLVNRDLLDIIRSAARQEASRLNKKIDFHFGAQ